MAAAAFCRCPIGACAWRAGPPGGADRSGACMNRRVLLMAPLSVAVAAGAGFWAMLDGMQSGVFDTRLVPSPLIGKPVPPFALPGLTDADLRKMGRPVLVNFFASWCVPCVDEADTLMALKDFRSADRRHRLQGQAGGHPGVPRPARKSVTKTHGPRTRTGGDRFWGLRRAGNVSGRPVGIVRWKYCRAR